LSLPRIDEFETIVQVQVSLALDQPSEALALLDSRLPVAKAAGRLDTVYKMMAFRSVAEEAIGDRERALTTLKKLLSQTAPQGYIRLYLDAGPAMALLLSQLVARGFEINYARQLLFNYEKLDHPSPVKTRPALPTPLSARELEVLALIRAGHTNREIAEELVISIGTVKRHISNMYRKLNVSSRTQALAKAEEFHIFT
jgi:LuxR family maltose regulon positive regulatory protein